MQGPGARRVAAAAYAALAVLFLALPFVPFLREAFDARPRGVFPLELAAGWSGLFAGALGFAAVLVAPIVAFALLGALAYGTARGQRWAQVVTVALLALLAAGGLMNAIRPAEDGMSAGVRAANVAVAAASFAAVLALRRAHRAKGAAPSR